jgi:putative peptidoglycan lipid II flippase
LLIMRQESFLSSLGTAAIWKGLDRISGFLKHVVIAGTIGLSAQLDVFYMAMALLGVFVFSWGNVLDVLAVPRMVGLWRNGERAAFRAYAGGMLILCLSGSLLLAMLIVLGWRQIASLALGFDAKRSQLLQQAFVWLIPVLIFYLPFRFMGSVMRALRSFSSSYQAEFAIAATVLVCVLLFRSDPHVLLWSFSLGITAAFFFLLFRSLSLLGVPTNLFSPEIRASLTLVPSLLIVQGMQYLYLLSGRVFVSFLPEGAVSALAYGLTLVALLPGMLGISGSFITVVSEKISVTERSARMNDVISLCIFVSVGITSFLVFADQALVKVLLERGAFSHADTVSVSIAIFGYSWMVLPLLLVDALDQIFVIERKTALIARRMLLGFLVNVALNAWFLFGLGWGIQGIAIAASLSYWVMTLAAFEGIRRLGYSIAWRRHAKWIAWLVLMMMILYAASRVGGVDRADGLTRLLLDAGAIAVIMFMSGYLYFGSERQLIRSTLVRTVAGFRGTR